MTYHAERLLAWIALGLVALMGVVAGWSAHILFLDLVRPAGGP